MAKYSCLVEMPIPLTVVGWFARCSITSHASDREDLDERMNPHRKNFYESLTQMIQERNTMLEKYLEQDKSLQRLSQEMKNVQKGLVGMRKDQQDQFERFPPTRGTPSVMPMKSVDAGKPYDELGITRR